MGSGGKARDGGEDFVGSFLPGKGFRGLIVRANKIRDGVNERTDAGFPIFRGGSSPAFKRSMHL